MALKSDELYAILNKKIEEGGGGGGGTKNYNELINKPQINGVELYGNMLPSDLGLADEESVLGIESNIESISEELDALKNYILVSDRPTTWLEVDSAVTNGLAKDIYAIGDMFSDFKWIDTETNTSYDYDMQVNHFEDVELEDGTIRKDAMWVQAHWAHPFGVQFTYPRAFLKCPNGLSAGTYYFTFESDWGTSGYVVAGEAVSFTITNDVPVGGRIAGCYNASQQAKSNWRIYVYDSDGLNVIETVIPTFEATGTNLGVQHLRGREGNLNSTQEMALGSNRWKTSAIRQYLNSSAGKGEWWTACDEWDIAPDKLNTKAGFLSGCSQDFIDAIKTIKVTTYTNTVTGEGSADITYDKVILPSLEQIYVNPQIQGEGEYHQYWKEKSGANSPLAQYGTYPNMITYAVENHNSPQAVLCRSADRGSVFSRWYVSSSGNINVTPASYTTRFSPIVVI